MAIIFGLILVVLAVIAVLLWSRISAKPPVVADTKPADDAEAVVRVADVKPVDPANPGQTISGVSDYNRLFGGGAHQGWPAYRDGQVASNPDTSYKDSRVLREPGWVYECHLAPLGETAYEISMTESRPVIFEVVAKTGGAVGFAIKLDSGEWQECLGDVARLDATISGTRHLILRSNHGGQYGVKYHIGVPLMRSVGR